MYYADTDVHCLPASCSSVRLCFPTAVLEALLAVKLPAGCLARIASCVCAAWAG